MTFSDLILKVRRRIADLRTASGSIITDASEDGFFLSSDQIVEITIEGLSELTRTLRMAELSAYINRGVIYKRKPNVTIAQYTGRIDSGDLPEKYSSIVSLQEQGNPENIYWFIDQEDFQSKLYRTTDAVTGDGGMGGGYFTIFYMEDESNPGTNIVVIDTLPRPTSSIEVEMVYTVGLDDIYTLASTVDLPFYDIDDIILSYIDRQVAIVAQDADRVKMLTDIINLKLGELINGLQRNKEASS